MLDLGRAEPLPRTSGSPVDHRSNDVIEHRLDPLALGDGQQLRGDDFGPAARAHGRPEEAPTNTPDDQHGGALVEP